MKNNISLITLVLAASCSGCAINVSKMYPGEARPNNEIAVYSPLNRGDFNGPSILTTHIDGKVIREYFPSGSPFGPYVAMLPGEKTVRVTFDDYENTFLWILAPKLISLKFKNFQGYYDVKFNAKPGKFYAPIFNYNLLQDKKITEMCVAELEQGATLSDTRAPQKYVACAKPSVPATQENIKICNEMHEWGEAPVIFQDLCRKIANK